jgi:branched-chain amino acid transport system permease protein
LVAAPIGIAAAGIAGLGNERLLLRPLRHKGTSLTSMTIISIGLGIGVRYIYLYFFGGRAKAFREYAVQKAHDFGPFSLTSRDLVTIGLCLVLLVAFAMYLLRTRMGKAIRAVSDNPDLASATGIDADHVILLVWGIGGALAGLGGILLGLDQQVRWDSGFSLLLLMFAAITLGGLGNPFGALAGALVIGMFVELWTWIFPSVVELKTLGALATLILVLLVRPQGLLGRKERTG